MRRAIATTILLASLALANDGASKKMPNPSASDRIAVAEPLPGCGRLERWQYRQGEHGGELWLARVDRPARVSIEAADRPRHLPVFISTSPNAVALNGGFYSGKKPVGLVLSHGVELTSLAERGGSGVFFVDGRVPRIVHRSEFVPTDTVEHALQSIDRLVNDGELLVNNADDLPHDARSFVAITAGGEVLLGAIFDSRSIASRTDEVTRLNRKSTTTGPTLYDLAELAARPMAEGGLGARWVLNLDGGWSTSMLAWCDDATLELAPYKATINAIVARWPAVRATEKPSPASTND